MSNSEGQRNLKGSVRKHIGTIVAVCGCLFSCPSYTYADAANDFVNAHGNFFRLFYPSKSELKLGYRYQPENDEKDGPGEFDLNNFFGELDLPLPVSRDRFFRFGFDFDARLFDFSPPSRAATSTHSETFYSGALNLGMGHFINDDFLITGQASLGAYSNFEDSLDEKDLRGSNQWLLVYNLNPVTQLVAGFEYSERFDDTPILPIGGLRLQSTDGQVHISITVPIEATVTINLQPEFSIYAGGWIDGDEYRVEINELDFNAQYFDVLVGAGFRYWVGEHINLGAEMGASVASELEFKVDDPGQFDGDLEPAPYVRGTMGIAF